MRLVRFRRPGGGEAPVLGGVVGGDSVAALRPALAAAMRAAGEPDRAAAAIPEDMVALIGDEAAMVAAARALAFAARPESAGLRVPLGAVELLAPLRPGKILGVGRNYAEHAKEVGGPAQAAPRIFLKPSSAVAGPGCTVRIPKAVTKPDYEAELGVVIGARVKGVSRENALEAVRGYVCANDVSARDFQFSDGQWTRGKSVDTFCPVGPLVPASEVPDPHALRIRAIVSGEVLQDSTTANLIFGIDEIIAHVTKTITLVPGDLILTGTPAGVGVFRDPQRLLRPGDEVTIEIDGLGSLTNPVVAGS